LFFIFVCAGQFLSELERHDEAAQHYLRAAELAPEDYEIVFNAANALRQSGQNAEAEMFYRHAVTLRPQVGEKNKCARVPFPLIRSKIRRFRSKNELSGEIDPRNVACGAAHTDVF
jgi:tetratricopeptide (TPR) repeat protein